MRKVFKALCQDHAEDWRRAARLSAAATLVSLIFPAVALAQAINVDLGTGAGLSERVVQLVGLLTVLSLGTRVVLSYWFASIPEIGVTGIWWSIPIGWLIADVVGIWCYRYVKGVRGS